MLKLPLLFLASGFGVSLLVACGEGGDDLHQRAGNGGSSAGASGAPPAGAAGTSSGGTSSGGSGGTSSGGSGGSAAGTGGAAGSSTGGSSGTGGSAGGGSAGTGGVPPATPPTFADCPPWPQATGSVNLTRTENVSGTFDGQFRRYVFGGSSSSAIFELDNNATLKNVIISPPGADGVHCRGNCTLQNVWWEDVGEDAATFEGSSASTRVTVDCAGAKKADDKVLQHNGGGTVTVKRFFVEDFGKLYRSCGNCDQQYERHAAFDNIIGRAPGAALAGLNENYGDTATFTNIYLYDPTRSIHICERYTGNNTGAEPPYRGAGPDAVHCLYSSSNVSYTK